MEKKIRKLLIVFFAVMLAFTFLSRAAASAMVAKVQVENAGSGNLTYEVTGTGIVKANAQKYISLSAGYQIGKVSVKKGQKVNKGDLLFTYSMQQLKETASDKKGELKKLKLQFDNVGLTANTDMDTSTDMEAALLAVENAEEDVQNARRDLVDIKKTVKKNKKKEYQDAASALEDVQASKEKAEKEAVRAVEDAKEELAQIKEPEADAKDKIGDYRAAVQSQDSTNISNTYQKLFDFYYDGQYDEHQDKINDAQKELNRAKDDEAAIESKWDKTIIAEYDQYSPNFEVRNAYYTKLQEKQDETNAAKRAVQDAQEKLNKLTAQDQKLKDAINAYKSDISNSSMNMAASAATLYDILVKGKSADKTKVTVAEIKLSRATQDQAQALTEWEKKQDTATAKVEKLQAELNAIKAGSYNYTEDEKEQKKELQEALRALKTARLQQKKTGKTIQNDVKSQYNQELSYDNERSILKVDIEKAQEELEKIEKIISEHGKIHAPVKGMISENDLEQGIILSGQEKLIITTGGYELDMEADKEDMKYFAAGDEVNIKSGVEDKTVTSKIENIDLADQDGRVKFTALLPKGSYQIGGGLPFTLSKDSENYSRCIPVQALRQDQQGTYVLLAKEANSVLGTVDEAFRINVTVISKDSKTAAVDGAITEEDNIITGSNRNFEEGDRVRIYEME